MVVVLLNWIYVFCTTYIVGHFVLKRAAKCIGYKSPVSLIADLFAGFAIVTAYAGYFSVFHKVSILANVIMLCCCVIFAFCDRKDYGRDIAKTYSYVNNSIYEGDKRKLSLKLLIIWAVFLIIGAIILFYTLFFTSYGVFHQDTGLYHAQSIRWIEEYGVIKGLGLIQNRFGYNSSFFCVSALYSCAFMGQSLHTLNGYLAALSMIYGLCVIGSSLRDKLRCSCIFSLGPFIYFVATGRELISPTTDPVLVYLVFIIIIMWVRAIEQSGICESSDYVSRLSFLCVMTAFLVSIKLSVGVMVLLVVRPAVSLVKEKRIKETVLCIVSAMILIAPYFIRNVIISGWLIYPFTAIDLFSLPWKITAESALHDANEITTWARYVRDAELIDQSVLEWTPVWWQGQTGTDHWFSAAAVVAVVVEFIRIVIAGVSYLRGRNYLSCNDKPDRSKSGISEEDIEYLFLEFIILMGAFFWFFSAPLIRYGYLYLILLPLAVICGLVRKIVHDSRLVICILQGAIATSLTVIVIFPIALLLREDRNYVNSNWSRAYAIYQKEYPIAETMTEEVNGVLFYYPNEPGTPVWYDAYPSVLYEENLHYFEFIGDDISEGVRIDGK